jgi:hypothetical protein
MALYNPGSHPLSQPPCPILFYPQAFLTLSESSKLRRKSPFSALPIGGTPPPLNDSASPPFV